MTLVLQPINIFVPYFDAYAGIAKYTEIVSGYIFDNSSHVFQDAKEVALFSWLNKLNPDWQKQPQLNYVTASGINGEQIIPVLDPQSVTVLITAADSNVDFWYKTKTIAKYGVIAPVTGEVLQGPLIYVNSANYSAPISGNQNNGIYCNFPGTTTATLVIGQLPPGSPQASPAIPPVMAYSPNYSGNYPLPAGVTPTSVAGPEILP